MKKTIIAGIVLGFSLTSVFASLDLNLKYGQKGDSVSELQEFLADKRLLTSSPTGFFGLLTLKAVKAYQLSQNLPATGYVGPMTREVINKEIAVDLTDSMTAEVAETGTTTPINIVPAQTTVYVPVYAPAPATQVAVAPVKQETYTIVTDNTSYHYSWWQGVYTLYLNGWVADSTGAKVNSRPVTCTPPAGEQKQSTFSRVSGGWQFECQFEGTEKGNFTYTLSVPDLNLTKTLEVSVQ